VFASISALAMDMSSVGTLGTSFTAPTVKGTANVANPIMGDIVYDWTANIFGGYDKNGTWQTFATGNAANAAVVTKTTNYTITSTDDTILADASGGSFTLTLPSASSNSGKIFRIQKIDSSLSNSITISRAGSDTVEGDTSTSLVTQYDAVTLISDGSATWYILARQFPQTWTSFSTNLNGGSPSFGTLSINTAYWRRNSANTIEIKYAVKTSNTSGAAAGSGTYTLTIPGSLTADTTVLTADSNLMGSNVGSGSIGFVTGPSWNNMGVVLYDSTHLGFTVNTGGGSLGWASSNFSLSNANLVLANFSAVIPISGWPNK